MHATLQKIVGLANGPFKPFLLPLIFALVIVGVLPLIAGYIVLLERKVMAHMQVRGRTDCCSQLPTR